MARKPRTPKTQFEISTNAQGNDIQGNLLGKELKRNRALDTRRDNDNVVDYKVKLKDIDTALLYYLDNVVLPNITDNGKSFKIPIIYGSPERWASVQKDGYSRDKDGKTQIPLMMFKRTAMAKNRTLSNKVDANFPQVYQTFAKQWSRKNAYNAFSVANNFSPVQEQYNVVVPDYVNITYEFIIWTDYVEQMNDIVEAINYSEGSYWGEPERFKFRTRIDDFTNQTDLTGDADRLVRTTFTLTLYGYIISDTLNRQIAKHATKQHSNYVLRFGQEVDSRNELTDTGPPVTGRTIASPGQADNITLNTITTTIDLSDEVADYLALNISKNADAIPNGSSAEFYNATIATAPASLPATTKDNFSVYINGQYIPSALITNFLQIGPHVLIEFNTTGLGYTLIDGDKVTAIGKFEPTSDTTI
jgi:hypothetical protein